MFKDFDRGHENLVSREQFVRVVQKEGLLLVEPRTLNAVILRFAGSTDRTARVDYRAFVADVDPPAGQCSARMGRGSVGERECGGEGVWGRGSGRGAAGVGARCGRRWSMWTSKVLRSG
jgi:hypothetical protein